MLTRSGLGAVLTAVVLGVVGWWWNYEEVVAAAFSIVAVLMIAIWVSQRPLRAAVTRRLVAVRVPRGDPIVVDYRVRNSTRFRSGRATIIDRCDEVEVRVPVEPVAANAESTAIGSIPTRRRGVFDVGPFEIERIDPFWLTVGRRRDAERSSVIVHPKIYDLVGPHGAVRVVENESVLRRAAADPMSGFVSMREYVAGDDPRMIHWPTTARTGTLMVREHVEVRRPEFTVVLDTAPTAGTPDDFEEAVDVAATLSVHAVRTGLDVVVRTTDRDHSGRPTPLVSDSAILDLLTPVPQSSDQSLLPVAALFTGGFDQSSVVFVTGPSGPSSRFATSERMSVVRVGEGATSGPGIVLGGTGRARVREAVAVMDVTDETRPEPSGFDLARLRIVVIAVGFAIVGAAAGGIFDRTHWTLVVAPIVPAMVAVGLVGARPLLRLLGAATAVVAAVILAVNVAGGSPDDVIGAFSSGVQGLLSTDWPSPSQPDLIATIAAGLATSCAVGAELAARRRFHLAALVPLLLAALAVVALSAPLGVRWWWIVGLIAVSAIFALLRNDGSLRDRTVLLRGERRLILLLATASVLVVVAMLPVGLGARADPRRNDPAEQTAPLLDPIEATLALQALDPSRDLHVVVADDATEAVLRWRTAALSSYDGRRWSPDLTLRPIGSTLGVATGPTIGADITFLDDNLTLVPLPGSPIEVGAAVETDAARTVVRLAERATQGDVIRIVANTPPSAAEAGGVSPRLVDESVSGLTPLAEALAGDASPLEQLRQLETTMRTDFVLDSEVQGGGLEQALIDRFLRDTQRGTAEQFATSFVLLARSLGIEARVATGFVAEAGADAAPGGALTLASSGAEVWPEIELADGTWLAYDPVPPEEATDGAPPPPEPQVQSPAAPQPPIAPPPESDNETSTTDDDTDATTDDALSTAIIWVLRGGVGAYCDPAAIRDYSGADPRSEASTSAKTTRCTRCRRPDPRGVGVCHRRPGGCRAPHRRCGHRCGDRSPRARRSLPRPRSNSAVSRRCRVQRRSERLAMPTCLLRMQRRAST